MTQLQEFKSGAMGQIFVRSEGLKPVYLVNPDSIDPYVTALSELIFWSDQLMEHAKFIALLTPMDDLKDYRERAVALMTGLVDVNEEAKNTDLDERQIRELYARTKSRLQPLLDLEMEISDKQTRGELHTLVWNSFLDHVAREQRRFMSRQEMFMNNEVRFDRDEIIDFWAQIMAEHSSFIAHLLDPSEGKLFMQALETSKKFWETKNNHPISSGREDALVKEVDMIIDFKTAALKGIQTGDIASIIKPELADHVRREAILFGHELKIADARSINLRAA